MNVAVIDYNAGNIYSVIHALERLGITPTLTNVPEKIIGSDKVIFPGQGEASSAMAYLREHNLDRVIKELKQPILGICIGQQLMCAHSEEGDVDCLGIFNVPVLRFQPQRHEDKVPHMGWNALENVKSSLFQNFKGGEYVYFVHSYYVPVCDWTIAQTEYIAPFSAALHRGNFYSTQFHPEKSGSVGEQILKNFLTL